MLHIIAKHYQPLNRALYAQEGALLNLLLFLTTTLSLPVLDGESQICSDEEQAYVRASIEVKDANLNLSYKEIDEFILGIDEVCTFNNHNMPDGLDYSLLVNKDNQSRYIRVRNGLDGSFKLFGPFKK